mmetsp:Transcript_15564/g.48996  ORF Transcript_15564/g.48996 Transcript_15564/m.48996 type:complete len:201 (-) Transcript_15564:1420-2022(-)
MHARAGMPWGSGDPSSAPIGDLEPGQRCPTWPAEPRQRCPSVGHRRPRVDVGQGEARGVLLHAVVLVLLAHAAVRLMAVLVPQLLLGGRVAAPAALVALGGRARRGVALLLDILELLRGAPEKVLHAPELLPFVLDLVGPVLLVLVDLHVEAPGGPATEEQVGLDLLVDAALHAHGVALLPDLHALEAGSGVRNLRFLLD